MKNLSLQPEFVKKVEKTEELIDGNEAIEAADQIAIGEVTCKSLPSTSD
jgi:hypothetical protein